MCFLEFNKADGYLLNTAEFCAVIEAWYWVQKINLPRNIMQKGKLGNFFPGKRRAKTLRKEMKGKRIGFLETILFTSTTDILQSSCQTWDMWLVLDMWLSTACAWLRTVTTPGSPWWVLAWGGVCVGCRMGLTLWWAWRAKFSSSPSHWPTELVTMEVKKEGCIQRACSSSFIHKEFPEPCSGTFPQKTPLGKCICGRIRWLSG